MPLGCERSARMRRRSHVSRRESARTRPGASENRYPRGGARDREHPAARPKCTCVTNPADARLPKARAGEVPVRTAAAPWGAPELPARPARTPAPTPGAAAKPEPAARPRAAISETAAIPATGARDSPAAADVTGTTLRPAHSMSAVATSRVSQRSSGTWR